MADMIQDLEDNRSVQSNRSYVRNKPCKTIYPLLQPLQGISDEIKLKADSIFIRMRPAVHRGKTFIKQQFYCTYCAYLELGMKVDPFKLGSEFFGLTPGEVQHCDSLFSPLSTGYTSPVKQVSPTVYIPGFCKRMNFTEETQAKIIELTNDVLRKDRSLTQYNPQTLAAGILRYFIDINGIVVENNTLKEITSRSTVTINSISAKIAKADNH